MLIEVTLLGCDGGKRKRSFLVSQIKSLEMNIFEKTLIGTDQGLFPVEESAEEILRRFGKKFQMVMCPHCLREVAALERCPVCNWELRDEKGRYEQPSHELGFAEGGDFV